MCHSRNLELYLNLGLTPLADEFRTVEEAAGPQVHYPLEVYVCMTCGLSQLGLVVAPEILYQQDYPYESSTTRAGRDHFTGVARSITARLGLTAQDLAVDIGSNVGVLVKGFLDAGVRAIGVDPAPNIAEIARANGIETLCAFFDGATSREIVASHGLAKVITATNVFAHVHDLDALMVAVDELLTADGLFVIEAPHLLYLIRDLEYDTIYHEHLSYLSARSLATFVQRHGFEIVDIQHADIHGGSFRVFIGRKGRWPVLDSVRNVVAAEEGAGIHNLDHLRAFAGSVAQHRLDLLKLLVDLRRDGKRIAGVSAPAKGMTLLNYCGIHGGLLEFVTEKAKLKIGRVTPGSRLPVLPDSALHERGIDYGLLLAWNFATEIIDNLPEFRASGGRFVIPIPAPRLV